MTSEIRTNTIKNRVGLGTIEYSNTGPVISGVTTASNFKTGSSNLHSSGVEVAGINVLGADTPIGLGATIYNSGAAVFTGVVTASSFSGSGDLDVDGHTNLDNVSIAGVSTFSGDLIISSTLPRITLNDTNHESDFDIKNENGSFRIRDLDNPTDRYRINSIGTIHEFFGAADFNSHLTVDGNITSGGEIKSLTLFESTSGNDLRLNAGSANRDIFLQVNDTTLMTVQGSTGNVGVGTMSPDTLVEIGNAIGTGTANLLKLTSYTNSQSSRPALVFWNNNPNTAQAQISAKGGASYNASKLHFSVANSSRVLQDRACIDEFGTFIIGPGETRRNTKGSNQHQVLLIEGTGNNSTRMSMIRNSNDDNGPEIQLIKTRGTSIGSVTKPNQNDYIGSITFLAGDDSDLYARGAEISVQATGTPANDRVPSDLIFSTTATSGATSPQQRLRITSDGAVQIGNLQTSQNSTTHTSATKLHIDSTKSIKIARLGAGSLSSTGWYTVAKVAASNGNYFKCYASIGGDFTQDMCVMELTGSFSASGGLQNTYAEPVFKAYRTGAHSTDRITRARLVKDGSNIMYLQIYIAGGVNSNTFGKSVLEYQIGAYSQNTADSGSAAMFETQASGLTGLRTLEVDDNAICVNAGSHKFYSGGNATERLTITSSGNVLINETSKSTAQTDAPLQIVTGSNGNTLNLRARAADNAYAYINFQDNAGSKTAAEIHMFRNSQNGGQLIFGTCRNNANYPTAALWIDKDGNVGINRSDPNERLNVNGNIELNAYDSSGGSGNYYTAKGLIIGNAYDAGKTGLTDDRNAIIWQERGLDLDFATNDTLRMKIDYNGEVVCYDNVAVGGNHPWAVTGGSYGNLSISGGDASSSGFLNLGNGATTTNADFDLGRIKFHNGSTEVARITATTATSSNNDANMFFATKHHGGSLTTKLTIHDTGGIQVGNTGNVSPFNPNTSGITGGLVLTTPVYSEYHYTWSGHSSYTIDLTCASYFSSEFIYVQHQTNGGSRMQQYARGKWSNNHYQHTLNVWEWSGSGGGLSVSFTASDQGGNGSINGLSNMSNNGSTYSGFVNGGGESNSTTANGRFRISETYNWGSVSSRGLIIRCYYGSFAISKS